MYTEIPVFYNILVRSVETYSYLQKTHVLTSIVLSVVYTVCAIAKTALTALGLNGYSPASLYALSFEFLPKNKIIIH